MKEGMLALEAYTLPLTCYQTHVPIKMKILNLWGTYISMPQNYKTHVKRAERDRKYFKACLHKNHKWNQDD